MNRILKLAALALFLPVVAWAQGFGKNKIQFGQQKWQYIQTQHFDIYFYQGGDEAAQFTASVAESALVSLGRTLKFELQARVPILVYSSHNDFEETNVTSGIQEESVGGFTEFFKSRVVLPYEGSNEQFRHVIHHELTHAVFLQYFYGAGAGAILRGISRFQIPLWLNEGLAEYESMHWDSEADNFMRDAVVNNYLPPLPQLYGFFDYKGGQSFYYWVERRYGRAKVTELLQELRSTRSIDAAFERALGEKVGEISDQWQKTLKEWYWPEIEGRQAPSDFATAFTDHRKTSNFINNSPALSPDGSRLAYLSDRSGLFDIYLLNAIDGSNMDKLVSGQKQSGLEELKWLRPGISWSPDNNHIVFAAKSGWQDVLHVVEVNRKRIIRTYELGFNAIWNPAWSPDGHAIVFTGMRNSRSDLFLLEVESGQTKRLTDDEFSDFEPSWSPDSKWIAFISDRGHLPDSLERPIWQRDYRNDDIYMIRPEGSEMRRLTSTESDESSPEFYHSPDTLLFISDRNGISNIYLRALPDGDDIPLTNMLVGAQQISISNGGERLAFTSFYRAGYDIYLWRNPLAEIGKHGTLEFTDAMQYRWMPVEEIDAPKLANMSNENTEGRPYRGFIFDRDFTRGVIDNGYSNGNKDGVDEPENNLTAEGDYVVRKYKPKFTVDYVGAVSGYDPFFGLQGFGQLYLSDLTGNHQIGIGAYLNRSIANSDFALSYAYQGWRPDVYLAFGQQVNFYLSSFNSIERFRFLNVLGGASYPFSRFARLDLSALYLHTTQDNFTFIDIPSISSSAAIFSLGLTRDNTRWGYYGPVDAGRSYLEVSFSPGFGSRPREFTTVSADLRWYNAMSREWSLAARIAGGASFGKQPQSFILGGVSNWINQEFASQLSREDVSDLIFSQFVFPLRGSDYYEQIGTRYFLFNGEIRFPFIQFLVLQAPLPLLLQQVRGAAFVDVGSAWNEEDGLSVFRKNENGKRVLDDVLASFGWGIRFYSPIGLLRIDAAWNTDLRNYSEPRYLFSLGTDF